MKRVEMFDEQGNKISFEPEEFCDLLSDSSDLFHIKAVGSIKGAHFIKTFYSRLAQTFYHVRINLYGTEYFIESTEDRFYELLSGSRGVGVINIPAGA